MDAIVLAVAGVVMAFPGVAGRVGRTEKWVAVIAAFVMTSRGGCSV